MDESKMNFERQYCSAVGNNLSKEFLELGLVRITMLLGIFYDYVKWKYYSIRYFNPESYNKTYNKHSISGIIPSFTQC